MDIKISNPEQMDEFEPGTILDVEGVKVEVVADDGTECWCNGCIFDIGNRKIGSHEGIDYCLETHCGFKHYKEI